MDGEVRHLVGLLLGTEDDWPRAFEHLVAGARRGARRNRPAAHLRHRAADHRAVLAPVQAADRPGDRPARLLVLPPARVAQEGRPHGRRVPAQLAVHVPGDGKARGLLRDDAARPEGAGDGPRPVQEPGGPRQVRLHRAALQPAVRPGRDRRRDRLSAVHEALRRRRLARRLPDQQPRRTAQRVQLLRRDAHAPAGVGGLRRVRPGPVDRRGDDGDAVRPRRADALAVPGRARLPRPRRRDRDHHDLPGRQRVLPVGVQLLRDARARGRRLPHRLRQRLPGHLDHLAALLLPVGDQDAAEVDGVLPGDRQAGAAGHRHPELFRHQRPQRPGLRPEAGRLPAPRRRALRRRRLPRVLRRAPGRPRPAGPGLGGRARLRPPDRGHGHRLPTPSTSTSGSSPISAG